MAGKGNSKVVIFAALIGNALISVSKFTGAAISGSSAMFSEGIHSLVDTGNQILLLVGIRLSKKPADANFPFGRGKEVYFWSFIVSMMIFALGGGISFYEGVHQIISPGLSETSIVNFVVLIVSFFFELGACFFAYREFKKVQGKKSIFTTIRESKDPTIFTILFEDCAALLGLVVALIGIGLTAYTGNSIYDGIASCLIGLILLLVATWLAIETKGLLIGESASRESLAIIKSKASEIPSILAVHEVLTMHMGPEDIVVNMRVDFDDKMTVTQLEEAIFALKKKLKESDSRFKRIFISAESFRDQRTEVV
jgi:cation diffusion facilitator family transporter